MDGLSVTSESTPGKSFGKGEGVCGCVCVCVCVCV